MRDAGLLALPQLRLVERIEQQHQKAHIVVERQAPELPVPVLQTAAEAAVAGPIARELLRREQLGLRGQIAEHQLLRVKELPHLRQTMRILPRPFGTRSVVWQEGQVKKRYSRR